MHLCEMYFARAFGGLQNSDLGFTLLHTVQAHCHSSAVPSALLDFRLSDLVQGFQQLLELQTRSQTERKIRFLVHASCSEGQRPFAIHCCRNQRSFARATFMVASLDLQTRSQI